MHEDRRICAYFPISVKPNSPSRPGFSRHGGGAPGLVIADARSGDSAIDAAMKIARRVELRMRRLPDTAATTNARFRGPYVRYLAST